MSEDLRTRLEAIRDRLEAELKTAEGAQCAAVAKELRVVLTELDGMKAPEGSAVADAAAARESRRAADLSGASAVGDERRPRGSRSRK